MNLDEFPFICDNCKGKETSFVSFVVFHFFISLKNYFSIDFLLKIKQHKKILKHKSEYRVFVTCINS